MPASAPVASSYSAGDATGSFAAVDGAAESLGLRDDMLAYGGLRMPSARSRQRGSLTVASQTDVYVELLVQQKIEVTFDSAQAMTSCSGSQNGSRSIEGLVTLAPEMMSASRPCSLSSSKSE